MSLFIYVSSKSVVIQKYKLELPFSPPPSNITKAAIGAYQLLSNSVFMQTESVREEQQEVINLLKTYGQALYNTIVPDSLKAQIYNEGGIFIFAMDRQVINLPWELIHDGRNFFNLTQGVIRINYSKLTRSLSPPISEKATIKISLNGYMPLEEEKTNGKSKRLLHKGIDFISQVELLPRGALASNPNISVSCNGNASKESILYELEKNPDILMFTGYDCTDGWILKDGDSDTNKNTSWYDNQIQTKFTNAIKQGLRILILNSSDLLEKGTVFVNDPLTRYFDIGIPYVISINGRISQRRFREYFQRLVNNLSHGESILKAHRFAINYIQSAMPLSWDWSWIQLHINKSFLEAGSEIPFEPFKLLNKTKKKGKNSQLNEGSFDSFRRFCGNHGCLIKIQNLLNNPPGNKIIIFQSLKASLVEEYLLEFFRRKRAHEDVHLEFHYYKRWGYHQPEKHHVPNVIVKQFSFLFKENAIRKYFDQATETIYSSLEIKNNLRYLIVFYPPDRVDSEFDNWMRSKQELGYCIILISSRKKITMLNSEVVNTSQLDVQDISNNFEDFIPEEWVDSFENGIPDQMKNYSLLKIARNTDNSQLFELFNTLPDTKALWEATFKTILPGLSTLKLKILLVLYFLRVRISVQYLKLLTKSKKLGPEIQHMYKLGLIEADYSFRVFWMPVHIRNQLKSLKLVPKEELIRLCEDIIQNQISVLNEDRIPNLQEIIGFQYNVLDFAELGAPEAAAQRFVQYLKKIQQFNIDLKFVFFQGISNCLEIVYGSGDRKSIQRTIIAAIDLIDYLADQNESLSLYEWLLKAEEKNRNWSMVAETQVKMAEIYARFKQPEKSIGLITSAVQLNNDIKNFSNRYRNIIKIALLLLDMDEFDQLQNLLGQQNFNFNKLSKEDVQKLWLIDGHILFHEKKYDSALESFMKFAAYTDIDMNSSLFSRTYMAMAEIYQKNNEESESNRYWSKAINYMESNDSNQQVIHLHEKLWKYHYDQADYEKSVRHLEWMFEYYKKLDIKDKIKDIANHLGGLYYRLGNPDKSTEFYKISQDIP